jgi:hypothetical protein
MDPKTSRSADCVLVVTGYGTLPVIESPDTIAMLRDRALGHEPEKLKAT